MADAYLEDYREQGFAVIRSVFAPAEVREMAEAFDRVYTQGIAHRASFREKNVLFRQARDENLGRILRLVQWPSYFDAVLNGYRVDRRILDILSPLLGRDIKQIINQLHWKPPGAARAEFGYHQDIRFRRPRDAYRNPETAYVQTGIAVDPHRPDNGAMTFYPGSHRLGEVEIDGVGSVMDRPMSGTDLRRAGLDPAKVVDLVLDPGDVALWNLYTIHGSRPNRATIDRRLYINGYVAAAQCDRGEWAFRDGEPCPLGEPALVHYEDLYTRPEPHYLDEA